MYIYTVTIECLSRAPQNAIKQLRINKILCKDSNKDLNKKSLIKAIKKSFPIFSFVSLQEESYLDGKYRESLIMKFKSYRQIKHKIKTSGMNYPMIDIKVALDVS